MSTAQRIIILIVCIDIFMYLGLSFAIANSPTDINVIRIPNDFLDMFLKSKSSLDSGLTEYSDSLRGSENTTIQINYDIESDWSSQALEESGQPAEPSIGFAFLDPLRIPFAFLKTLMNLTILPITLLSSGGISPLIPIIFGFPLAVIFIVSIILLIRGLT